MLFNPIIGKALPFIARVLQTVVFFRKYEEFVIWCVSDMFVLRRCSSSKLNQSVKNAIKRHNQSYLQCKYAVENFFYDS